MDLLVPSLVLGAISGMTYALAGAGLVVVYRTSRVINFAQGDLAALGLFVGYSLSRTGMAYWMVALATIAVSAVAGLLLGRLVVIPFSRRRGLLETALVTVALSLILQGITTLAFGPSVRSFPSIGNKSLGHIGEVVLTQSSVATIVAGVLSFALIGALFKWTTIGTAMRAVSDNPRAARLLGVPTTLLESLSWLVSGALAGLGGLLLAPVYSLHPTSMTAIVVFGAVTVVVGGFDSIFGAMIAGITVGVVTNVVASYVSTNLVMPAIFLCMVAVLLWRPFGLLGRVPIERV